MRVMSTRGAMITMVLVTVFAIGAASVTAALGPGLGVFGRSSANGSEVPVTSTVREVWQQSGQNYDKFVIVVRSMTLMSVKKRGLQLDATRQAGQEIGLQIRAEAQRDPDQLLYAVVDAAVRQYGKEHAK